MRHLMSAFLRKEVAIWSTTTILGQWEYSCESPSMMSFINKILQHSRWTKQ